MKRILGLITAIVLAWPALAQGNAAIPPDAPAPAAATPERHKFILTFERSEIESMGLVRSNFERDGVFAEILDSLASNIVLPQDVPVTFKDCGDANAFWDPEAKSITYCYELVQLYNKGYDQIQGEESAFLAGMTQDIVLTGTTAFVLMHELGHGFIQLFDLPVTGREEDAVDQFATLLLIGGDEPGMPMSERTSRVALLGAFFFKELADNPSDLTREILADEHALGQQRYYDVMCLVMGSDSDAYAPVLTPGMQMVADAVEKNPDAFDGEKISDWIEKTDVLNILPQARAMGCEEEYSKLERAWTYMVQTFMGENPPVREPAAKTETETETESDE